MFALASVTTLSQPWAISMPIIVATTTGMELSAAS
jgi:hypothetical protein